MHHNTGTVFYYYAGSQNWAIKLINSGTINDDNVILAERIEYVILFAYVLAADCLCICILWCLYVFNYKIFHGSFFKYLTFVVDFLFDVFYSTFPLLLIGRSNFSFLNTAASIHDDSVLSFLATFLPLVYNVIRLFRIFAVVSRWSRKEFYAIFNSDSNPDPNSSPNPTNTDKQKEKQVETTNYSSKTGISLVVTPTLSESGEHEFPSNQQLQLTATKHLSTASPVFSVSSSTHLAPIIINGGENENQNENQDENESKKIDDKGPQFLSVRSRSVSQEAPSVHVSTDTKNNDATSGTEKHVQPVEQESKEIKLTFCNICCYGDQFINIDEKDLNNGNKNGDTLRVIEYIRKCWIAIFVVMIATIGLAIATQMMFHINERIPTCTSYDASDIGNGNGSTTFNAKYSHLYAWKFCDYPVYPVDDPIPCQCRNLFIGPGQVMELSQYLNSDEMTIMFKTILKEFYMLETFYFEVDSVTRTNTLNISQDMMVARELKILKLSYMEFGDIPDNMGDKWSKLEYIQLIISFLQPTVSSSSWSKMNQLKVFDISQSSISLDNIDFLCSMPLLKYIQLPSPRQSYNQN